MKTENAAHTAKTAALVPAYTCSLVRDGSVKIESRLCDEPRAAANILRAMIGNSDREQFAVIVLDARRRAIGAQIVSVGTLSASLVHPREVFKPALLLNGAAVIVGHNHPSGDPSPSAEDREATKRLRRAGELLGVPLADHVVIGEVTEREPVGFFSFRNDGIL